MSMSSMHPVRSRNEILIISNIGNVQRSRSPCDRSNSKIRLYKIEFKKNIW